MLQIAEADILQSLERDNPWWSGSTDNLRAKFPHRRAYFSGFRELVLNWKIQRSVILMGPRRVGKTVMLQQGSEQELF